MKVLVNEKYEENVPTIRENFMTNIRYKLYAFYCNFSNYNIISESYSVVRPDNGLMRCDIIAFPSPGMTLVNGTGSTGFQVYVYNLFTDGEDCKTPNDKFWIPNMSYYHVNDGNSQKCTSFLCQNGDLTKSEGKFYTAWINVLETRI